MRIGSKLVWNTLFFLVCLNAKAQEVLRTTEVQDAKGKLVEKIKSKIRQTPEQTTFEHLYIGSRYFNPETNKPIWIDSDQLIADDEVTKLMVESTVKKVRKKVTLFGVDLVQALIKEPDENQIIVRYHDNQTLIPFNSDPYIGTVRFELKPDLTAWIDTLPSLRFKGFFVNQYSNPKKLTNGMIQIDFSSHFVVGPINKEEYKSIYLPNGGIQYQTYMTHCEAKGTLVVDPIRHFILSGQYALFSKQVDMLESEPGKYSEVPHESKMKVKIWNELAN